MKKSNRSKEIKALEKLRLPELQAKFAEVTGEKSRSPNRTFLIRRITEALEARAAEPVRQKTGHCIKRIMRSLFVHGSLSFVPPDDDCRAGGAA